MIQRRVDVVPTPWSIYSENRRTTKTLVVSITLFERCGSLSESTEVHDSGSLLVLDKQKQEHGLAWSEFSGAQILFLSDFKVRTALLLQHNLEQLRFF